MVERRRAVAHVRCQLGSVARLRSGEYFLRNPVAQRATVCDFARQLHGLDHHVGIDLLAEIRRKINKGSRGSFVVSVTLPRLIGLRIAGTMEKP